MQLVMQDTHQLLTSFALVNDSQAVLHSSILESLPCAARGDDRSCQ